MLLINFLLIINFDFLLFLIRIIESGVFPSNYINLGISALIKEKRGSLKAPFVYYE
jgi:hypothetical protein